MLHQPGPGRGAASARPALATTSPEHRARPVCAPPARRLAGSPRFATFLIALVLAGLALPGLDLSGGCLAPALAAPASAAGGDELLRDGDFEATADGNALRRDDEGQDWYESRKQSKSARELLKFSTRKIAGNATRKAMIKAHPEKNTYLSQRLAEPQAGRLVLRYDICVKQIRPEYDRSAFCFLGTSSDRKRGPNSTGAERFVFLGFQNTDREGRLALFAREGDRSWDELTLLADDLAVMTWYTVTVAVDVAAGTYTVQVDDGPPSAPLRAFRAGGGPPRELTHVSFASWNDGAGTFYVDNVSVRAR